MNEFEKNKRAIFLTEKNYERKKTFLEQYKDENVWSLDVPEWIKEQGEEQIREWYSSRSDSQLSDYIKYTQLLYSAGRPMEEVITATHDMLERFHRHFDTDFPEDKLQLWEADSYAYILWLLGLAVLSNHRESLERIPTWLAPDLDADGNWIKGGAPLVDAPLKALLDLIGYKGRVQVNPEPFFPKSVWMLIPDIINPPQETGKPFVSPIEKRSKLMQQYLRGWHKTNKDTYWYDYHEVRDGELFFGFWSFEAGILALLLNITLGEKEFKGMTFYPQDYVEYARANGFASLK